LFPLLFGDGVYADLVFFPLWFLQEAVLLSQDVIFFLFAPPAKPQSFQLLAPPLNLLTSRTSVIRSGRMTPRARWSTGETLAPFILVPFHLIESDSVIEAFKNARECPSTGIISYRRSSPSPVILLSFLTVLRRKTDSIFLPPAFC